MTAEVQNMEDDNPDEIDLEFRLSLRQRIKNLFLLLLPGDQYDVLLDLFSELPIDKQQEWLDEFCSPPELD